MANLGALNFDGEGAEPPAEAAPPQVFVRTFAAPVGLPWDQNRAAQLEARHGAPLPIGDLIYRLKRLNGWAPGRIARFAVFYVRKSEYVAPFEATVDVDGDPVRVGFGAGTAQLQRVRQVGLIAALLAICATVAGGAMVAALSARAQSTQALETLEHQTAGKLRAARKVQAQHDQDRALGRAQGLSGLPQDVLADLAWVVASKSPDARIVALHWDHGLLAIESRGEAAPIQAIDRQVTRAPRPARASVTLWGVSRAFDGEVGPLGGPARQ